MAQKLFPILADPNPPSSFDGLDVSLVAGQITALNGADSFNMTASTLTANSVSASWADIVDAVVNPPADQDLQSVLNAGNTASGDNAFMELSKNNDLLTLKPDILSIEGSNVQNIFSVTNETMLMTTETRTNTMVAGSISIVDSGSSADSVLNSGSLDFTGKDASAGRNAVYGFGGADFIGLDTAVTYITPNQVALSKSGESATFTTASLTFAGTSPTETAVLSTASLVVGQQGVSTATYSDTSALIVSATANRSASFSSQGTSLTSTNADARTTTYNNNTLTMTSPVDTNSVVLTGAGATPRLTIAKTGVSATELTQTGLSGLSIDGKRTMSLTTPTAAVNSATLASSGDITLNATGDLRLSGNELYLSGNITSSVAGGSTDQYLVLSINGTPYKISLLALI